MAAYAATVSIDQRRPAPLTLERDAIVTGTIDVTNYNTTLAELTTITGFFRSLKRVVITGVSDNGYAGRWDATAKAVKCYYADYDAGADGALIQGVNDLDCGVFEFIAYGVI